MVHRVNLRLLFRDWQRSTLHKRFRDRGKRTCPLARLAVSLCPRVQCKPEKSLVASATGPTPDAAISCDEPISSRNRLFSAQLGTVPGYGENSPLHSYRRKQFYASGDSLKQPATVWFSRCEVLRALSPTSLYSAQTVQKRKACRSIFKSFLKGYGGLLRRARMTFIPIAKARGLLS